MTIPLPATKKVYLSLLILSLTLPTTAQKKNEAFQLNIRKTTSPIEIDGIGNDLAWQDTDVATNFYMVLPMDTGMANEPSEIRMTYDEKWQLFVVYGSL